MRSRRTQWLKTVTHVAALTPLILLAWGYWRDSLGADPISVLTRRTGRAAIILLLLSLTPTVVRTLSGFRGLLPLRRALGLYAFLYAALHFLVFTGLDYGFDVQFIWQAIREGRRVLAGLVSGLLLIPLALTSTNRSIERLGANWKRLHRLAYLASLLAVLHYVWTFKELRVAPLLAGGLLLLLFALRLPPMAQALARTRAKPPAAG